MRYDRARRSLDRQATYIVSTFIAGATRHRDRCYERAIPSDPLARNAGSAPVASSFDTGLPSGLSPQVRKVTRSRSHFASQVSSGSTCAPASEQYRRAPVPSPLRGVGRGRRSCRR
jgi:hypothetical protein